MSDTPKVLLIDDEANASLLPSDIMMTLSMPNDDTFSDVVTTALLHSDLVLIDHNLQLPAAFSLTANDGASLLGHLRSWARANECSLPPIVIYTSEDEAYREEVPAIGPSVALDGTFEGREHLIAPVLDVEWLIKKGEDDAKSKISAIAKASAGLKVAAGNNRVSSEELASYLRMPAQVAWKEIAKERLSLSRPPLTEPTAPKKPEGARGIAPTIRWLLQRALPFHGLFVSDLFVSWMLGVPQESIDMVLAESGHKEWAAGLKESIYQGPASELFARRWWSPGIDYVAWQLRSQTDQSDHPEQTLREMTGVDIKFFNGSEYVVGFDADLKESGLILLRKAVQLHPRGWPAEALEPWMDQEEAIREPLLWATVAPGERMEAAR